MKITRDTKLAVAVALERALKPLLSDLKAENASDMAQLWEESHVSQCALMVGGIKVGTSSFTAPKQSISMRTGKEQSAIDYLREVGLTEEIPVKGWQDCFSIIPDERVINSSTGEDVSNLFCVTYKAPVTTVRGCKYEDVAAALNQAGLTSSDAIAGLLGS